MQKVPRVFNWLSAQALLILLLAPLAIWAANPVTADNTVETFMGQTYVYQDEDFPYSDADGDPLTEVIIMPAATLHGSLEYNGSTVNPGDIALFPLSGRLTFAPDPGYTGLALPLFNFILNDATGSSSGISTIFIDVISNHDPQLFINGGEITGTVNLPLPVYEDGSYQFGTDYTLTVDDVDILDPSSLENQIIVNVMATKGVLDLAGEYRFVSGDGTANLTIVSSVNECNALLHDMTYIPSPNLVGAETLTVRLNDQGHVGIGGGDDLFRFINFDILPINDAPTVIRTTGLSMDTIDEDDPDNPGEVIEAIIDDGAIYDPDGLAVKAMAVTAVDNRHGVWQYSLNGVVWNDVYAGSGEFFTFEDDALLLDGSNRLRFVPAQDYNGSSEFRFHAWDMSDGGQTSGMHIDLPSHGTGGLTPFSTNDGTVLIRIREINDDPCIGFRGAPVEDWVFVPIQVDANLDYHFTAADSLCVTDPDVGEFQLIVNLQVTKGVLDFGTPNTRFISGDRTNNVVIVTHLDQINEFLTNFEYISNADANGLEQLTVIMNDQGHTGLGGGEDVERNIFFALTNDPPEFTSVPADTILQNQQYTYNIVAVDDTVNFGVTLTAPILPAWLSLTDNGDGTGVLEGFAANQYVGINEVKLRVDDGIADPVEQTFTIEVININDAPEVANPIPDQNTPEDWPWSYAFPANTFHDPDTGDVLSYSALMQNGDPLPLWMNFDPATRTFSGTPGTLDVGVFSLAVTAMDLEGETVTDVFNLTVTNMPDPPYVNVPLPDTLIEENSNFDWVFPADTFLDPDPGDHLTYTAMMQNGDPLAAWVSFDGAARRFHGSPVAADIGKYYIRVIATDNDGLQTDDVFLLWVTWVNTPPFVVNPAPDQTATEDSPYFYTHPGDIFDDNNFIYGDTLSYTAQLADGSPLPAWLSYNGNTRTFSGTPLNEDVGVMQVLIVAHDAYNSTAADTLAFTVINTNDAPYLANEVPDQNATEDTPFSFTFVDTTFIDIDPGDSFTYTSKLSDGAPLPGWLHFDGPTRTYSGTPYNEDVRDWLVRIYATDIGGVTVSDTFHIDVANTNDAPFVVNPIPNHNTLEDAVYSFTFVASTFGDSDLVYGDQLSYTADLHNRDPLPTWLSFDAVNRTFSGVPRNEDVGVYLISVRAEDLLGAAVADTFQLEVINTNDAPEVANPIPDQLARETYAFDFVFADNAFVDPDIGDNLTYTARSAATRALPGWLSFSPAQRRFTGLPDSTDIGFYTIEVIAADNLGETNTDTFIIEVRYLNDAPTLVTPIADQFTEQDDDWSFIFDEATFADDNLWQGDTLFYAATLASGDPLPAWLAFDGPTRTFSGTPDNTDVGLYSVHLVASDRDDATADDTFDIDVNNLNDPPYLVNPLSNQTIFEGNPWDYQLPLDTFDDPDLIHGDRLTWTADLQNGDPLPAWITYSGVDRSFSGTPTNSDLGDFFVRITVTDDSLATASNVFRLRVSNQPNHPYFVSNPDTNATEDVLWSYHIITDDLDPGSVAAIGAGVIPVWTTLVDSGNGSALLYGTPTNDDVGDHTVELFVDDGVRLMGFQSFTINVANTNDAPYVANPIPDQQVAQDHSLGFTIPTDTFDDVDAGDDLEISVTLGNGDPLPGWVIWWSTQHLLVFSPGAGEVGVWDIAVTATDLASATVSDHFDLVVTEVVNQAPYFTSTPVTDALEDQPYSYHVEAADDSINFGLALAATTLPDWLGFVDNGDGTGELTGTPGNDDLGDHNVVITVSDNIYTPVTEQAFVITVDNINSDPYLSRPIPDHTTFEDAAYAFTFDHDAFVDPDPDDVLTYSAEMESGDPLPAWMFFNASTRTFSGIPHNGDVGVYDIRVIATDLMGSNVSDVFQLEVLNLNDDPFVATPLPDKAAVVDVAFDYTIPAGSFDDPDLPYGDELYYDATLAGGQPLPEWLTFDNATQTFAGTPADGDVGVIDIEVTVADIQSAAASDVFSLEVFPTNDPPQFDSAPVTAVDEGAPYAYNVQTSDDAINLGGLVLAAPTLPAWLTFVDNGDGTGLLSGTPDNGDVGSHNVELTVSDGVAEQVAQSFDIAVTNVNNAPVVVSAIPNQMAWEDLAWSFTFDAATFDDPDLMWGDALTYTATLAGGAPLPMWLGFDGPVRTFSGTPANEDVGQYNIEVTATDIDGLSVADVFMLDVQNAPDAPFFTSIPVTSVNEDALYTYNVTTDDADTGAVLHISAPTLPGWLTLTDNGSGTALLSGTPLNENVGPNDVVLTVDDGVRLTDTQAFTIDVANTNDAPIVNIPLIDVYALTNFSTDYTFDANSFIDVDAGDALSYSAQFDGGAMPGWVAWNSASRAFNFSPTTSDIGTYTITVTATDLIGAAVSDDFQVRVDEVHNQLPFFTSEPVMTATEDVPYVYNITAEDSDDINFGLSFGTEILPPWLTLVDHGDGTATLSGTPLDEHVGLNRVFLYCWDNILNSEKPVQDFIIDVADVNDPPHFATSPNTTATQDVLYNYIATVQDDGMDVGGVAVTATTLPDWMSFNDIGGGSYELTGTPTNADVGSHHVVLEADDHLAAPVYQDFYVTVDNVNDPPALASGIGDQTAYSEHLFNYAVPADAFSDPDLAYGDQLIYTAQLSNGDALPAWLTFGVEGPGVFYGVPEAAYIGMVWEIEVTAADDAGATASDTFFLDVYGNVPPTITSTPVTAVNEDEAYAYHITTYDPDSVQNIAVFALVMPDWLTLVDNGDGTADLTGTPANDNVGEHAVQLWADDGVRRRDAVVQEFTITVTNVNDAPTVANRIADQFIIADNLYDFTFAEDVFNDVDAGDALSYAADLSDGSALPGWLSFDAGTRNFNGTPALSDVGDYSIRVTASDIDGASAADVFTLMVSAGPNSAPTFTSSPITAATEGVPYNYNIVTTDDGINLNGDVLAAPTLPGWLTLFDNGDGTGALSGTPTNDHVGDNDVTLTISDGIAAPVEQTFTIVVSDVQSAPYVANAVPNQSALVGTAFSYTFGEDVFADDDPGDVLSYDAEKANGDPLPLWLGFDGPTRTFSGTPDVADVDEFDIRLIATDTALTTADLTFTMGVFLENAAPSFTSAPLLTIGDGNHYEYAVTTTDDAFNWNGLVLSAPTLPGWLGFVDNGDGTGVLSGDPTNANIGDHPVVLMVDDGIAEPVTQAFTVSVINQTEPPVLNGEIRDLYVYQDDPFNYTFAADVFVDPDPGDVLTYTAEQWDHSPLPAWLAFDGPTRTFSGAAGNDAVGRWIIRVTATDISGNSVFTAFDIVVWNVNDAPFVANAIPDHETWALTPYNFVIPPNSFGDPDEGDALSFKANLANGSILPDWLGFNATQRTFSGIPEETDAGVYDIKVTVVDSAFAEVSDVFQLTVLPAQNAPIVANPIPDQVAYEDVLFDFVFSDSAFVDPDPGDHLAFNARQADGNPLPQWLTFVPTQRRFIATPTVDEVGSYDILVTATDNFSNIAQDEFTITVHHSNDLPVYLTTPDTTATQDQYWSYAPVVEDIDVGDFATLSAPTLPAWLTFVDNGDMTGLIEGTPGNADVGANLVVIAATDSSGVPATQEFSIEVANLNDAPTLVTPIPDQTIWADTLWTWAFDANTFDDIDIMWGDHLTYTAQLTGGDPLPAWLAFDGPTRTFSGTASNTDRGLYDIEVTATDDSLESVNDAFLLTVIPTQEPPVFISTPDTTATQDILWSYAIITDDMNGDDNLVIAADVAPAWLTLVDNGDRTALLSGTPGNDDVGQNPVTLSVFDGTDTVTQDFIIDVANVNDAPFVAIPLDDQSVAQDVAFNYVLPVGAFDDIDIMWGDVLTLTATLASGDPLPAWLTFDGAAFTGTPVNADVGVYDIRVTATDSEEATVYDDFTLSVDNVNDPPTIALPEAMPFAEDTQLVEDFASYITDIDPADELSLSVAGNATIAVDITGLMVTFSAPTDWNGAETMTFTVNDNAGRAVASDSTLVEVTPVNDAPVVANPIPDQTIPEDTPFSFPVPPGTFDDADFVYGDALTYTAELASGDPLPAWIGFDGTTFSGEAGNDAVGDWEMVLIATDNDGATARDSVLVTVENVNDAPTIDLPDSFEFAEDTQLVEDFASYITDIDPDDTLTLVGADNGLINVSVTGLMVTFSAPANWNGAEEIVFTVDDNAGRASASDTVLVSVTYVNDAPVVANPIPDQTIPEDTPFSFPVPPMTFDDADLVYGDALTYTAELVSGDPLPAWIGFDGATFSGEAGNDDVGDWEMVLIATDNDGATARDSVLVTVENVNDAPTIVLPDVFEFAEDTQPVENFADYITDIDPNDTLTLTASGNTEIIVDINGLMVTFSTAPDWNGDEEIVFTVNDNAGRASASDSMLVSFTYENDAPTVIDPIDPITMDEDTVETIFLTDVFGDADVVYGDDLTYSFSGNNHIAVSVDADVATLDPEDDWFGVETITFTATDLYNESVSTDAVVTVENVNDPPTIDLPETFTFAEDTQLVEDFANYVADIEQLNSELTLSVEDADTINVAIDGLVVTFTAPENWNGEESMTFTIDDNQGGRTFVSLDTRDARNDRDDRLTASDGVTVEVTYVNDAPTVANAIADLTMDENTVDTSIDLNNVFDDVDLVYGDELTFSVTGEEDITVDIANGVVTLTPDTDWYGEQELTFTATDDDSEFASDTVLVTVINVIDVPEIDAIADTMLFAVEEAYTWQVTGYFFPSAEFTLTQAPDSMIIGLDTGLIEWTPTGEQAGVHEIIVKAENTEGEDEMTFTVTLVNQNEAPTLFGDPSPEQPDQPVVIEWEAPANTPWLTGYKLYYSTEFNGDYTELAEFSATAPHSYTHEDAVTGAKNYYRMSALLAAGDWTGESALSTVMSVYPVPHDEFFVQYDDGTAETGFNGDEVGVQFSLDDLLRYIPDSQVIRLAVYLYEKADDPLNVRIYSGSETVPGTVEVDNLSYPAGELTVGWNILDVPANLQPVIQGGEVFISVEAPIGSHQVGLDTNGEPFNRSWADSGTWTEVNGNLMIRAVIATGVPRIAVDTAAFDFGDVFAGEISAEQSFIISNMGNTTLSITSLTTPDGFEVRLDTVDPWSSDLAFDIPWDDTQTVFVRFVPTDVRRLYTGDLVIESNDVDDTVVRISLRGNSVEPMPNAFTPNGDGLNDVYTVKFVNGVATEDAAMRIYDRQGRLIREIEGLASNALEWDGKDDDGNTCVAGPYLLVLERNGSITKRGKVYLIR